MSRSLIACLSCRKSKIRCDGDAPCKRCRRSELECVYNNPRPSRTRRVSTEEPADGTLERHDQLLAEHSTALGIILNHLGLPGELDTLSGRPRRQSTNSSLQPIQHIIPLQAMAKPYLVPQQHLGPPTLPLTLPSPPGLIEAGVLELKEANAFFQQYLAHSTSRLATLLPVDHLPIEPSLLRDVILTLGIRSCLSADTEDLHKTCIAFTRHRIMSSGAVSLDDVSAGLMFGQWYSDHRICRMVLGWAMELGLHHSASAFQAYRLEDGANDAAESRRRAEAAIKRLRIWMSCCSAEMIMSLMSGLPVSAPPIAFALQEASGWLFPPSNSAKTPQDVVLASYVTDFDYRLVSYVQLMSLVVQYRESLPFSATNPSRSLERDAEWERLLLEYDGYMRVWATRWHAGLDMGTRFEELGDPTVKTAQAVIDRHRLRVILAYARCYIHSFGLRSFSSAAAEPSETASRAVRIAANSALDVIRWSLETKLYQAALNSSMDYMLHNCVGFCLEYISSSLACAPSDAFTADMAPVIQRLAGVLADLKEAGMDDGLQASKSKVNDLANQIGIAQTVGRIPTFENDIFDFGQPGVDGDAALNNEAFSSLAGMVDVASFWLQTDLENSGFWNSSA